MKECNRVTIVCTQVCVECCTLVCGLSVFDPEAEAGRFRAVGGGAIARGLESAEIARVVLREGVGGEDFGVEAGG